MPTNRADQRLQREAGRRSGSGVGTATAISCSNAVPVLVTQRRHDAPRPAPTDRGCAASGVAARERARRVLRELPVGVVDLRPARSIIGSEPPARTSSWMPVVVENGALDRERLDRRRAVVEAAQRIERGDPGEGRQRSAASGSSDQQQPDRAAGPGGVGVWSLMPRPPRRRTCPSSRVRRTRTDGRGTCTCPARGPRS